MRRKKSYAFKKDVYYFTVKSSPRDITMFRDSKEDAARTFESYLAIGKKMEWLGKWNGKKFEENTVPTTKNPA